MFLDTPDPRFEPSLFVAVAFFAWHRWPLAASLGSSCTSSYVYIRLVLVTSLAEKIQRTIFYISIFPTVSKMYSKQRLLGYLDHLLTD